MSNERIDLTQLEWMISDYRKKAEEKTGRTLLDLDAIAMVPDLIAELKRCYEELDKWTSYATYIENVDMDCHKDASAEAGFLWKCTDCGAHFELPENGIYECEFGCDASE